MSAPVTVRVALPVHLRRLAGTGPEVAVEVTGSGPSLAGVLDALEAVHLPLRGTIRDRDTGRRRAFVRYFAGTEDLSHDDPHDPLPADVAAGREPLRVVGAMAGG